jgi:hypothetical protein
MINWGALIIPLDIVSAIADAEECLGWLGGGGLKQEQVFVVTSAQIGAETKYCSYFMELFPHRSFDPLEGGFQEQLIPWRRSPSGLLENRQLFKWFKTSELASEITLAPEEIEGKGICVCMIEQNSKGPKVRALFIESQSGLSRILPMDTIAVMEGSDPFSRIPEEMTKALRNTRVTIAGVGSGGGEVALNLASAGVGHIVLFDDDRLHPENYVRHALTKRDLEHFHS